MKFSGPRILLRVEGAVVLVGACFLYHELGASWGWFAAFFFVPDVAMFGYLLGRKIGARAYNSAHTYVGPFLLWTVVYFANRSSLLPVCVIWIAHIGFDRLLGYGLKYETDFKDTHLGRL